MNQQDIKKLILKVPLFKNLNSAEHDTISSVIVVRNMNGQIILTKRMKKRRLSCWLRAVYM